MEVVGTWTYSEREPKGLHDVSNMGVRGKRAKMISQIWDEAIIR